MKSYTFVVQATISLHVTVQAETLESAKEAAQAAGIMGLCHQCARGRDGEWCTSGELDCDPASSPLVEVTVDHELLPPQALESLAGDWAG
jgi:hypothetical protein